MAVRLVERRGAEFQPHPAVARPDPAQGWHRPLSAPRSSGSSRALRQAAGAFAAGAAIATLGVAALYRTGGDSTAAIAAQPAIRLGLAALIAVAVTAVHKRVRGQRSAGYSLARAQTLLCIAGALTMILIDNSVARAFGIAGAASIVRFRTPIEDPTDATVMFLLMGLGMASGVGAIGLAVAGAAGVCLVLAAFATLSPETHRRNVIFELVGSGYDFPAPHVHRVFAKHGIAIEPSKWSQDAKTTVKYRASIDETLSLEALGAELMNRGEGALQSVAWEVKKHGS